MTVRDRDAILTMFEFFFSHSRWKLLECQALMIAYEQASFRAIDDREDADLVAAFDAQLGDASPAERAMAYDKRAENKQRSRVMLERQAREELFRGIAALVNP